MKSLDDLKKINEGRHLEYKAALNGMPKSLFETVCAFLNQDGGEIYLGVDDNGELLGIDNETADKIVKDIPAALNNPKIFEPTCLLEPEQYEWQGRSILCLKVPQSSRVHRLHGVVYDRRADGDFKVKDPERIAQMVSGKAAHYSELKSYPHLTMDDLDLNTLDKARNLLRSKKPNHPWLALNDENFLKQAGLFQKDKSTGKSSLTLAAVLLFGTELTIQSVLPQYKIDVLIKKEQVDRYDNRLDIRENLIEANFKILPFLAPYLPDPFYLEKNIRISLRDRIFRELIANLIVHREYTSHLPARILVFKDHIEFSNPCTPHHKGPLDIDHVVPYQKNPLLSKLFLQFGWVEEIGSGFTNIQKWLPLYQKDARIIFNEDELFISTLTLHQQESIDIDEKSTYVISDKRVLRILNTLESAPKNTNEIHQYLSLKRSSTLIVQIASLLQAGLIEKILTTDTPHRSHQYRLSANGDLKLQSLKSRAHSQANNSKQPKSIKESDSSRPKSGSSRIYKHSEANDLDVNALLEISSKQPKSAQESDSSPDLQDSSRPKSDLHEESYQARILKILQENDLLSKKEITITLNHKSVSGQLKKVLDILLAENLIEFSIPEKPQSRLQKYRLASDD